MFIAQRLAGIYSGAPFAPNPSLIRNSPGSGSTNGVIGGGGVLPLNWNLSGLGTIVTEVIGAGTEQNVTYNDIRFSGTTSTLSGFLAYEAIGFIRTQGLGDTWSTGALYKLGAGSMTNINSVGAYLLGRTAAGTANESFEQSFVPDGNYQRAERLSTFALATTVSVWPAVVWRWSSGVAIDITLRIAVPFCRRAGRGYGYGVNWMGRQAPCGV